MIAAEVIVDWHIDSESGRSRIPFPPLRSGETRALDLSELQQLGTIPKKATWATVTLSYIGSYGDVVAATASYDSTGRYGLQSPFSPGLSKGFKGGRWRFDATHNTLLATGNGGVTPVTAAVTLYYDDGRAKYELPPRRISPGEQFQIDVGSLITNQVPDQNGRTLPLSATSGLFEFRQLDSGTEGQLYEGRLVIDKTFGHATYGCAACCGYDAPTFDPGSWDLFPGDFSPAAMLAWDMCGCHYVDVSDQVWSWWSDDDSVAWFTLFHEIGAGNIGHTMVHASVTLPWPFQYDDCKQMLWQPVGYVDVNPPPTFDIAYSSYIPVDHVFGPPTDLCTFNLTPYNLIYAGDANRGTYRTTEAVRIIPDLQQSSGDFKHTGKTRNYGAGSPIHPPNLTLDVAPPNGDDDIIANDCHWWNAEDQADSSSFLLEKDYPANHQGHVRFKGAAANPLVISPEIDWEFDIVVDATNPSATTARLTWKHDCYPAHIVKVNGKTVYHYVPNPNDWTFIFQCLSGVGQVTNSVGPIAVPPQPPQ